MKLENSYENEFGTTDLNQESVSFFDTQVYDKNIENNKKHSLISLRKSIDDSVLMGSLQLDNTNRISKNTNINTNKLSSNIESHENDENENEKENDENEEEELELVYNPVLNCYFDPKTGQYYQLK